MAWKNFMPMSIDELHRALVAVHENRANVKEVLVDHSNRLLRVDHLTLANGVIDDFMIPLKAGTTNEVDDLLKVMLRESERGLLPSRGISERIFEYLDNGRR